MISRFARSIPDFGLSREQQTERIMRAMDNPYFNILGHATGRLLLKREGYELDMERIIEHAKVNGCLFEINSSPDRLDLSDEHAKHAGIKIAVNTDAHSIRELDFISAGINQARRAWLEPSDVMNTRPLKQLQRLLRRESVCDPVVHVRATTEGRRRCSSFRLAPPEEET